MESATKTNSPPIIVSANILPEVPSKDSELNLFVRRQGRDGDPITYSFQWMKNDEELTGENKNTLKSENFKKGDLIRAKVTFSDGKAKGETFLSSPVKIINSPPVIKEVRIEPKIAYTHGDLKVFVKSMDADGDSINYTYKWEKNGVVLSEENTEIFGGGRFKRGDSIAVTVIPHDGETLGTPKKSEPVTIANSPPIIISSPPNKTDGNIYTYQITANDPDNDAVVFALKTAPKGMEIDKETGLIRWEIRKEDQGTQSIEIEASDSEGAKSSQRYTLSIELR
jgi:hypothetical protein